MTNDVAELLRDPVYLVGGGFLAGICVALALSSFFARLRFLTRIILAVCSLGAVGVGSKGCASTNPNVVRR